MTGTASNMGIEENLALAKRKGNPRTLKWGITRAERSEYIEKLKRLDLGLEKRLNSKVGLLSGGQRQALTLLMATLKNHDYFCLTNIRRLWTQKLQKEFLNLQKR